MSHFKPRQYAIKRDTARGIVVKDGCLLLLERTRPGLHYYSTPGGGIETGETLLQAVAREIHEETSLVLRVERKVFEWHEGLHVHHFFLCTYISGEPHLQDDAEENQNGSENIHVPCWVSFNELAGCDFGYWGAVKEIIVDGAKYGFSKNTKIITTKAA